MSKKPDPSRTVPDPALYRLMCEPHGFEEAEEVAEAFFLELQELRKKYRIRDMLIVTVMAVKHHDGHEADSIGTVTIGNQLLAGEMAAYALGRAEADLERIASTAKQRAKRSFQG